MDRKEGFFKKNKKMTIGIVVLLLVGSVLGGVVYYHETSRYVYTDKAELFAPIISLVAKQGGILKKVHVEEGQKVSAHETLARVGSDMITSEVSGVIVKAEKMYGKFMKSGDVILTMMNPEEMVVKARVDEDKGISEIRVGQEVSFTVDAYGSKEFTGVVKAVVPSKRSGDIVFSISDKREVQQFEVMIAYNHAQYPDFQNGMSARVWIRK